MFPRIENLKLLDLYRENLLTYISKAVNRNSSLNISQFIEHNQNIYHYPTRYRSDMHLLPLFKSPIHSQEFYIAVLKHGTSCSAVCRFNPRAAAQASDLHIHFDVEKILFVLWILLKLYLYSFQIQFYIVGFYFGLQSKFKEQKNA